MSDTAIFVAVIGGLALFRIAFATWVFLRLLPDGTGCPHCDADTFRVQSRGWNLLLPWFRTSWCPGCGWEGLLRQAPPMACNDSHSGQLPDSSKKSSK
jgi:hypothetical protein